jgi:GDP-4-dehydro-6-deoxy-D-mannose reductase
MSVGNLEIFRDFSLVSDLIDLLEISCSKVLPEKINLFNVCSGQPRKLINLANELSSALNVQVQFKTDQSKVRKDEPKVLIGSNAKVCGAFDWKPTQLTDKEFINSFLKPIIN